MEAAGTPATSLQLDVIHVEYLDVTTLFQRTIGGVLIFSGIFFKVCPLLTLRDVVGVLCVDEALAESCSPRQYHAVAVELNDGWGKQALPGRGDTNRADFVNFDVGSQSVHR